MITPAMKDLMGQRSLQETAWVEIEGLPYAWGSRAMGASFFAGRDVPDRKLGMKASLTNLPRGVTQNIDTSQGGNLSAGSVEFVLNDIDGSLVALANIVTPPFYTLSQQLNYYDTTVLLNDITGLSAGQLLYIGTETIKIGTVTTVPSPRANGCTRGMYQSEAQTFPAQFPVGTQPWVMANRRVWFKQAFSAVYQTLPTDANSFIRFAGTCKSFYLVDGERNAFTLTVESIDKELDRNCFTKFRSFNIKAMSIAGGAGVNGTVQAFGYPGYYPGYDYLTNFDPHVPGGTQIQWGNNEVMLARVDDEIIALRFDFSDLSVPKAYLIGRGLYDTEIASHSDGTLIQEIIPVVQKTLAPLGPTTTVFTSNTLSMVASKFSVANRVVPDDHPLSILLQVLLSGRNGGGLNGPGPGGRFYDHLPPGWGMGLPISRVDVAAIEAAALEDPTLRFGGYIAEPQNFIAFCRELCQFAGYYFVIELDDKFTIKKLRPPLPDASVVQITKAAMINNRPPSWEANWKGAVRELTFKFGYDYIEDKYRNIVVFVLNDADIYSKGLARTIEYTTRFVAPGGSSVPGSNSFRPFDVDTWLLSRADFFRLRYGKPPPITRVSVDYSFIGVELGDLLSITDNNMPNIDGTRGVTEQIGEVINKSIEDESRTVVLTLLMTGYSLGFYRYIAPSFIWVDGQNAYQSAPDQITLAQLDDDSDATGPNPTTSGRQFSRSISGGVLPNGTNGQWNTRAGNYYNFQNVSDTSDYQIRLWSADWQNYQDFYVYDTDGSSYAILSTVDGSNVATWAGNGCVITLGPDHISDSPLSGVFGFFAKANNPTGLNGRAPHKLFPT